MSLKYVDEFVDVISNVLISLKDCSNFNQVSKSLRQIRYRVEEYEDLIIDEGLK